MANRFLLSARTLRAGFAALLFGVAVAYPTVVPAAGGAGSPGSTVSPSVEAAKNDPGVVRDEIPVLTPRQTGPAFARRPLRVPPPLEEVVVFTDSLNGLSIGNEGNWTHVDNSARPTAWHIDSLLACQGKAWWCGRVDSSWVFDSNRMGYENSWSHYLENGAWLDSIPNNAITRIRFRHRFKAENVYDVGQVQIYDLDDGWVPIASFTGDVHGPGGGGMNCDTVTVVIPEFYRAKWYQNSDPSAHGLFLFRFAFTSDVAYSSADGLYDGDGWIVDNITITVNTQVRFFDNAESGPGNWFVSIFPPVGDYYQIASNVLTEDICTENRTNVWAMWDPVVQSLVPRLDNLLRTPAVPINQADDVFVAFDVYRNLPLYACFYYHLRYRTRNVGQPWGEWIDPTRLLYYGSTKDWARQRVSLSGAANKDSLMVEFGVTDYGQIYCDGNNSSTGVYTFFDNVIVGVVTTAPPVFIPRDIDFFNDTFNTTAFSGNDNINTAVGDSTVIEVNASRGYKSGFMYWRANGGSFSAVTLQTLTPALPRHRSADVPAGNYPANTTIDYYFAVTDSLNETTYYPAGAITDQHYLSASVLPVKSAINPPTCVDSLASILFVNNFSGREQTTYFATSLKGLGYKFDTWDVNAPSSGIGNTPAGSTIGGAYDWPASDVSKLTQYSTIIWHAGNLNSFTIRPEDQALLQSWIQQPGKNRNLWIAGDNIADDMITREQDFNSFLGFTCGVRFFRDLWESLPQDSLLPLISGVAGSPTDGRVLHIDAGCPLIDDFDLIGTSTQATANGKAGTILRYPGSGLSAAQRYATKYVSFGSDSARVAFFAFSFNSIVEGGERLFLTQDIMSDYFKAVPCYSPTSVAEDPAFPAPPIPNSLAQNSPNPFNPSTSIKYSVAQFGPVKLRIYNAGGALIRTLVDAPHAVGTYTARWDGTDDGGRRVGSGVYFYRIESANGFRDSKKLVLLK